MLIKQPNPKEENMEEKSVIDKLFDEDNNDVVVLRNENGEDIRFEQIATIPMKNTTYFILLPLDKIDGVGENEGLVFEILETEEGEVLSLVTDGDTIDKVFAVYDELVDDANAEVE